MDATTTDRVSATARGAATSGGRPRRPLTSRFSVGHALAVVAAVLAALLNLVLVRGGDAGHDVLVAARDIAAGETVAASDLATATVDVDATVAAGLLAATAFTDGQVAVHAIAEGEPLVRSALRSPAAADGLRAMSIPVDPTHAVGGALRVGDRVDVIEVVDDTARYLATGIEVLAVGERATAIGAVTGASITVAVDDRTALALAAAIRADGVEVVRSTGASPPATREYVRGGG